MSRHLGLIIGVNQYQDSTFRPLQFAESDAKALAQWLVNSKGGKWSPPDVQLVQGHHATRELTQSLITQLCTKVAESGDIVLIYFAGHAFLDERTGDGYLALANTRYQDATSGLSLRAFAHNILPQSRAAQILCILDSFQTGQLWNMRRSSPFDAKPLMGSAILSALQHHQNRLFLCSCRGNNFSPEVGEHHVGTFLHHMIVGLCGPASESRTGNVTLSKLHAYLCNVMREQHRPQLFGQQQSPLVLVGEPSFPAMQQATNDHTGTMSSGLSPIFGRQAGPSNPKTTPQASVATQVPPAAPQGPFTSGHIFAPALEEHRQQQCQQMLAQAEQLLQSQNYGAAFDLAEKILQIAPNNTEALILKGQLLGISGRFQEALIVIKQILQAEPNNAMGWSMRAVALNNTGQHQSALTAIERSLKLDPRNPETSAIKSTIMANLVGGQRKDYSPLFYNVSNSGQEQQVRENPGAFFIGAGLHLLGLICGIAGAGLLIFGHLPSPMGLLVESVGLAVLCVSAAHGAFRYGISRLVLTLFISLIIGGILGGAYILGFTRIMNSLSSDRNPTRLLQFLFFALWMIAASSIPFVLAIGGFISGLVVRARKHVRNPIAKARGL